MLDRKKTDTNDFCVVIFFMFTNTMCNNASLRWQLSILLTHGILSKYKSPIHQSEGRNLMQSELFRSKIMSARIATTFLSLINF